MCGSLSGRLVLAGEVHELDVETDEVVVRVDAEVVVADCALETAGQSGTVNDLIRCRHDVVGRCELEGSVGAVVLALARVVDVRPSSYWSRVGRKVLTSALWVSNLGEIDTRDVDLGGISAGRCGAGGKDEECDSAGNGGGLHTV